MTRTEINAAIADALDNAAGKINRGVPLSLALQRVAAELRAAEPVSEPVPPSTWEDAENARKPAPPPLLVDRLRSYATSPLMNEAADALEAAQAWSDVAAESNKAIDAYLRSLLPSLPEHYGMPVDGIRRVFQSLVEQLGEAQTDSRRLDWLDCNGHEIKHYSGTWAYEGEYHPDTSRTLRAAIDLALAATMERKPK